MNDLHSRVGRDRNQHTNIPTPTPTPTLLSSALSNDLLSSIGNRLPEIKQTFAFSLEPRDNNHPPLPSHQAGLRHHLIARFAQCIILR